MSMKKLALLTMQKGLGGDSGQGGSAANLTGGDILGLAIFAAAVGGVLWLFLTPPADETGAALKTSDAPIDDMFERAQAEMAENVRREKLAESAHRARTMTSPL